MPSQSPIFEVAGLEKIRAQQGKIFREIEGGVCAAQGFRSSGISAGIKKLGGKDMALVVSDTPCSSAGTFTTNSAKAAPVLYDLEIIRRKPVQGVIMNSGNANACTGEPGLKNARRMAAEAQRAVSTHLRNSRPSPFLVCSTGRIGIQLPIAKIQKGIHEAASALERSDLNAAEAMMTTDTFPKRMAVEVKVGGKIIRIGGMAKGAGMIHPGMSSSGKRPALHATMLCILTTDADIATPQLQKFLDRAVGQSFNRICVDGDMSTNDTVLLLANGHAKNRKISGKDAERFQAALNYVTLSLALMITKDGEGISKVVTMEVTGAASAEDAEKAVRAISNSILVKTSWCGEDPNWGRIYDSVGYSGAKMDSSLFCLKYNGMLLVKNGLEVKNAFQKAQLIVKNSFFHIECCLHQGKFSTLMYTTDLTEKYVELNKGE